MAPIAPIVGKLRKRLWLDASCAFGLGISAAYAYWYVASFLCYDKFTDSFTGMGTISRLVSAGNTQNISIDVLTFVHSGPPGRILHQVGEGETAATIDIRRWRGGTRLSIQADCI